jgi:hypothetical protein
MAEVLLAPPDNPDRKAAVRELYGYDKPIGFSLGNSSSLA